MVPLCFEIFFCFCFIVPLWCLFLADCCLRGLLVWCLVGSKGLLFVQVFPFQGVGPLQGGPVKCSPLQGGAAVGR